jgi:lipopolysaccharide transport system ATP-binding protein
MIEVKNLFKYYKGYSKPTKRILSALSFGIYKGDLKYLALEDISFTLGKGEILGIVGRNGAGKSTLLKILTGVSDYDRGSVKLNGRISSLLELSVGFNPELTGRENLYYNGLIYGFTSREMLEREDSIFEFAGLREFKDLPLKNFSSGMNVRLGFSLATFYRPDILLIDEALSVGDASFQQKSLKRIKDYVALGTSVIVVSHDLHLLSSICTRILVFEKGKLLHDNDPKSSLAFYMQVLAENIEIQEEKSLHSLLKSFDVRIQNQRGIVTRNIFLEEEMHVIVEFRLHSFIPDLTVGFHIEDTRGIRVFGTNSHILESKPLEKESLHYNCTFSFPVRFREGKYSLSIAIHKGDSHLEGSLLWKEGVIDFEVERVDFKKFEGLVHIPVKCKYE